MKEVNECIICGEKNIYNYKAAIAPLLAERIWNKKPFNIKLVFCKNCGFAFYNPRLEEHEIQSYYKDYREESYQKQRFKHEPFYTKELNEEIGSNVEVVNRKENLFNLLKKYTDISAIKSVLDYGGDRGQVIIDQLSHTDRYVFDISKSEPIDGIIKINNLEDCKKNKYGLIMCTHVLEHVSYPLEMIENIKALSDKNTILYLELPMENPFYHDNILMKFLSKIVLVGPLLYNVQEIFKKRKVLSINKHTCSFNPASLQDLLTLMPKYLKRILAFRKFFMHEHVSYFTPQSLENMLVNNGFKDVAVKVADIDCGWSDQKFICCLAKINN